MDCVIITNETLRFIKNEIDVMIEHSSCAALRDGVIVASLPSFAVTYVKRSDNCKLQEDLYGKDCFWPEKVYQKHYTVNQSRKRAFYETDADVFRELIKLATEFDKVLAVYQSPADKDNFRYTFVDKACNEESEKK